MTATETTPAPLSLEAWGNALHEAARRVPGLSIADIFTGKNETTIRFDYAGMRGWTQSFALPFERLPEEYKRHAIEVIRSLPADWRQGRRG